MLEPLDFAIWIEKLNISEQSRTIINQIRGSEPSRRVRSGRGAVIGTFPSRKMKCTIQFESHRNELPLIHELEHDPEIFEFYDQPPPFKISYRGSNGKNIAHNHTPDFFVIGKEYAGWIECKTESELLNLSIKQPNRFVLDESGNWQCPPGEQYASQYGLKYVVRSNKEINWNYQRNLEFLDDYYRVNSPPSLKTAKQTVIKILEENFGLCLSDLFERSQGVVTKDEIHFLIAWSEVYVDLHTSVLTQPEQVKIFVDHQSAQTYSNVKSFTADTNSNLLKKVEVKVGNNIIWDGKAWQIANTGFKNISLVDGEESCIQIPIRVFEQLVQLGNIEAASSCPLNSFDETIREIISSASVKSLSIANERWKILKAHLENSPLPKKVGDRTLARYRANYRRAEAVYGTGYVGLIPKSCSGNKNPKISDIASKAMDKFILEDYETLKQKRKHEVYALFIDYCKESNIEPPSQTTFNKRLKQRPQYEQTLKRQGRKAAYNKQPFYFTLDQNTPRHGERPFHIAHIDHTELDAELRDSETDENLGRPWLTLLIDAYSRIILAFYLSFDKPSYKSCMMVLRECVKRYGRFPQILVTDGGKEFSSVYYETLLAIFECTKKTRPPAESRFGNVVERIFNTTNTQFVHNLQGNTQIMKNVRQVTKAINPKSLALWNLSDCNKNLHKYCYEIYPGLKHSTLGQTPMEVFAFGNQSAGTRTHKLIPYNEDFKILTLPLVKKSGGTLKIVPLKGVKVSNIYYWTPSFNHPEIEATRVHVRYDPYDVGHCYAYINKQWTECFSEHYNTFKGCSEKLLMLASNQVRQQRKLAKQDLNLNASILAAFLKDLENEEQILKQKSLDRESGKVISIIDRTLNTKNEKVISEYETSLIGTSDSDVMIEIVEDFDNENDTYETF